MFHVPNIHVTDLIAQAVDIPIMSVETEGIKEEELEAFINKKEAGDEYEEKTVNMFDFETPHLDIDSLAVQLSFARQADSLLRVK